MKLHADYCHLVVSVYKHEYVLTKMENEKNKWEKLLGVNIANELKFGKHILEIRS